ncbi:MAG: CotH kinase family protein [Anaerolineae bacterium]|nr:CotH kinase family protein [Anaerolineae bacterium]
MKIGQNPTPRSPRRLNWSLGQAGLLMLMLVLGLIAGAQGWHNSIIHNAQSIPTLIGRVVPPPDDLPTLIIDMKFTSYNQLLTRREQALEAGVSIPSAGDFVTATAQLDGATTPIRMRLPAGPAAYLGTDERWSFEVRVQDERELLGMQRFYLADPAANNWLNQWAFARDLEREGILVARYQFVRLIFNGRDWGIYALQEGFATDLLAAHDRREGVIVEFDADLLWESIAHFQGDSQAATIDPVTNLSAADIQYFEVDAFRDATIDCDPDLSAQRERAIGLLRALQTGRLPASAVFDAQQYGRFLALVDLWGATQSTSLVNLRYYYNPTSDRLEPIGFNGNPLRANERLSLAATYGDPVLQAAYVEQALRISQLDYLDQLHAELEPERQQLQHIARAQAGDEALAPPWDELRRRQEQIRRSLDPAQPVFAYLGSPTQAMSGTLGIDVGNILNLPVEIVGFDINGATFLPAERESLSGESVELLTNHTDAIVLRALDVIQAPVIRYAHFDIRLADIQQLDSEIDFTQELEIHVITRILGLSATRLTRAQYGYPDVLIVQPEE